VLRATGEHRGPVVAVHVERQLADRGEAQLQGPRAPGAEFGGGAVPAAEGVTWS
jgi:hypothetical protein